jgi:hypothetical protein
MKESIKWFLALATMLLLCVGFMVLYTRLSPNKFSTTPAENPGGVELPKATGLAQCQSAPFVMPSAGWVGVLYGDSILGTVNHSGLDIFGLEGNGVTPVYAAYDGYATRLPEWISAVIIRHPQDPLMPGRQIWTYYTHMSDQSGQSYIIDQIPPGTVELPVNPGGLLTPISILVLSLMTAKAAF